MSRTITLAVDLPASPARLYRMYLDPKQHAAFTGSPVRVAARARASRRRRSGDAEAIGKRNLSLMFHL
jgi:uncharacterized protein YndB with AHSA1/START domain